MGYFPDFTSVTVLTAAQIKSLHTAPVLVAPGRAGCIVDIKSVLLEYIAGSQVFNPVAGDKVALITGTLPNAFVTYASAIAATNMFQSTTNKAAFGFVWWSGVSVATQPQRLSNVIGQGIQLYQYRNSPLGAGANWTLGNGTAKLTIQYSYIVA